MLHSILHEMVVMIRKTIYLQEQIPGSEPEQVGYSALCIHIIASGVQQFPYALDECGVCGSLMPEYILFR